MASGYIGEREKFTKRKNKTAADQYMDNFEEFTDAVKSELRSYEYKTKKPEHIVQFLIELRDKFDIQQELLLDEVLSEIDEE